MTKHSNSQIPETSNDLAIVCLAITRLLIQVTNLDELTRDICRRLTESGLFQSAWMVVLNQDGRIEASGQSGLDAGFHNFASGQAKGDLPGCMQEQPDPATPVRILNPGPACSICELHGACGSNAVITMMLEEQEAALGWVCLTVSDVFKPDRIALDLLENLGRDLTLTVRNRFRSNLDLPGASDAARLAAIVESSDDAIIGKSLDGIIWTWNKGATRMYGYQAEEAIGRPISIMVPSDRPDELPKIIEKIQNGEKVEHIDTVRKRKDGALVQVSLSVSPIKDGAGRIIGASTVARDVTERKITREALKRTITELTQRVRELNCLYAVSRLLEKPNSSIREILEGTVQLLPAGLQYPELVCARASLKEQSYQTENFQETSRKVIHDLVIQGEPSGVLEVCYLTEKPDEGESGFLPEEKELIQAIAERLSRILDHLRVEEALRTREKNFRTLIENALTGISLIRDDQVIFQNPEHERLMGALPLNFRFSTFDGIHPDDREKFKEFFDMIETGEVETWDTDFRFYPLGKNQSRPDLRWVHCRASSIDYQDRRSIVVNMMDLTRAKELEHLLRTHDKMTSLGHVAAGLAHEIRNPLSGINIYLSTLGKIYDRADSRETVEQILGQLQSASRKIESVIKRVMDFSKPSEPHFTRIDIAEPLEEALNLSAVTLRKRGIQVEKHLEPELPACLADPHMIEEVILNLLTNAAEAMKEAPDGKKIRISTAVQSDRIHVTISDSGPGVPASLRGQIFDPFFTTKSDGTGIGLSIGQRIMTDHGGLLTVTGSDLGGAAFTLEIPISS